MTTTPALRRLDRERDGRAAAPIRIAHLGPGNFFRAHQAWYTEHAPDAPEWGIAAFSGRRAELADALRPLLERFGTKPDFRLILFTLDEEEAVETAVDLVTGRPTVAFKL